MLTYSQKRRYGTRQLLKIFQKYGTVSGPILRDFQRSSTWINVVLKRQAAEFLKSLPFLSTIGYCKISFNSFICTASLKNVLLKNLELGRILYRKTKMHLSWTFIWQVLKIFQKYGTVSGPILRDFQRSSTWWIIVVLKRQAAEFLKSLPFLSTIGYCKISFNSFICTASLKNVLLKKT
jgi:hypothetical protein